MNPAPRTTLSGSVLVTHRNCADGAGCAVLYIAAGGRPEDVRYVPAGGVERWIDKDPQGDVVSGRPLVIVDVGLSSREHADALEKRGEVVLLDHHRTSQWLSGRSWCHVEMDGCGTELLRRWLGDLLYSNDCMDKLQRDWQYFAQLIDDRDRWQNKLLPSSKRLVDLMNFIGQEDFVRRMADFPWRLTAARGSIFSSEELFALRVIEEQTKRNIDSVLKRTRVFQRQWDGRNMQVGYVISSERQVSDLLDEMMRRDPSLDCVAQINFDMNMVSLRSRAGLVDVSQVAQVYGGGGHFEAAGHPFAEGFVDELIGSIHL